MIQLYLIKKYFFHASCIILSVLLVLSLAENDRLKKQHQNKLLSIEKEETQRRLELTEQARAKEKELVEEYTKLLEEKRLKDEAIKELNATIDDNSDRLYKLAKEARGSCPQTPTTKVVTKTVRVPTSKRGREDSEDLALEMARDFERVAVKCATHYEELKNEAVLLESKE